MLNFVSVTVSVISGSWSLYTTERIDELYKKIDEHIKRIDDQLDDDLSVIITRNTKIWDCIYPYILA